MSVTLSHTERQRAGCLLVQYRLARVGIDSATLGGRIARHTRLVVRNRNSGRLVELSLGVTVSGSRTGRTCEWSVDDKLDSDFTALVDLSSERIWILAPSELADLSSPHDDGRRRIHTYSVPTFDAQKTGQIVFSQEFDDNLLERRVTGLLGGASQAAA